MFEKEREGKKGEKDKEEKRKLKEKRGSTQAVSLNC